MVAGERLELSTFRVWAERSKPAELPRQNVLKNFYGLYVKARKISSPFCAAWNLHVENDIDENSGAYKSK